MKRDTIPKSIRDYMRRIGSKGGRAGAANDKRKAALVRWGKLDTTKAK